MGSQTTEVCGKWAPCSMSKLLPDSPVQLVSWANVFSFVILSNAMPSDTEGAFKLLASSICQGVLVVALAVTSAPPTPGIFNSPGDICDGFIVKKEFWILSAGEWKMLVETTIKHMAPVMCARNDDQAHDRC